MNREGDKRKKEKKACVCQKRNQKTNERIKTMASETKRLVHGVIIH